MDSWTPLAATPASGSSKPVPPHQRRQYTTNQPSQQQATKRFSLFGTASSSSPSSSHSHSSSASASASNQAKHRHHRPRPSWALLPNSSASQYHGLAPSLAQSPSASSSSSSSRQPESESALALRKALKSRTSTLGGLAGLLPKHVVVRILSHLAIHDVVSCALAARSLARIVSADEVWRPRWNALGWSLPVAHRDEQRRKREAQSATNHAARNDDGHAPSATQADAEQDALPPDELEAALVRIIAHGTAAVEPPPPPHAREAQKRCARKALELYRGQVRRATADSQGASRAVEPSTTSPARQMSQSSSTSSSMASSSSSSDAVAAQGQDDQDDDGDDDEFGDFTDATAQQPSSSASGYPQRRPGDAAAAAAGGRQEDAFADLPFLSPGPGKLPGGSLANGMASVALGRGTPHPPPPSSAAPSANGRPASVPAPPSNGWGAAGGSTWGAAGGAAAGLAAFQPLTPQKRGGGAASAARPNDGFGGVGGAAAAAATSTAYPYAGSESSATTAGLPLPSHVSPSYLLLRCAHEVLRPHLASLDASAGRPLVDGGDDDDDYDGDGGGAAGPGPGARPRPGGDGRSGGGGASRDAGATATSSLVASCSLLSPELSVEVQASLLCAVLAWLSPSVGGGRFATARARRGGVVVGGGGGTKADASGGVPVGGHGGAGARARTTTTTAAGTAPVLLAASLEASAALLAQLLAASQGALARRTDALRASRHGADVRRAVARSESDVATCAEAAWRVGLASLGNVVAWGRRKREERTFARLRGLTAAGGARGGSLGTHGAEGEGGPVVGEVAFAVGGDDDEDEDEDGGGVGAGLGGGFGEVGGGGGGGGDDDDEGDDEAWDGVGEAWDDVRQGTACAVATTRDEVVKLVTDDFMRGFAPDRGGGRGGGGGGAGHSAQVGASSSSSSPSSGGEDGGMRFARRPRSYRRLHLATFAPARMVLERCGALDGQALRDCRPLENLVSKGNRTYSLDFTPMDRFMSRLLDLVYEDGSHVARVLPTAQRALHAYARKVANDVIGAYISPLLERCKARDAHLFLRATAATFTQSMRLVDALLGVPARPDDAPVEARRAQFEAAVYDVWRPRMDEYLVTERQWVKGEMKRLVDLWEEDLQNQSRASKVDAAFLTSQNPAAVKRSVLSGFKDVLLLPVTVVPRTAGYVGSAVVRTAGTGLSSLNPMRWQSGNASAAASTAASAVNGGGAATPSGRGSPMRDLEEKSSAATVSDRPKGYIDFSSGKASATPYGLDDDDDEDEEEDEEDERVTAKDDNFSNATGADDARDGWVSSVGGDDEWSAEVAAWGAVAAARPASTATTASLAASYGWSDTTKASSVSRPSSVAKLPSDAGALGAGMATLPARSMSPASSRSTTPTPASVTAAAAAARVRAATGGARSPSLPAPTPAAAGSDMASSFSKMQLLLSLDTALQLIHVNRDCLRRVETFAKLPEPLSSRVRGDAEEIAVALFQSLGDGHIAPGFSKATAQIQAWNPAEAAEAARRAGSAQTGEAKAPGAATHQAGNGGNGGDSGSRDHGKPEVVEPLVNFFELVHVADTMQQMAQVYFDQELSRFVRDRTDFLNAVVREKKRFESQLDEAVARGLNAGVDLLMGQAEHILTTRQRRDDFCPGGEPLAGGAAGANGATASASSSWGAHSPRTSRGGHGNTASVTLDLSPTRACTETIECLRTHCRMLVGSTDKNVLEVFHQELALRLHAILFKHLKRQRVSLDGGFKLISDLNAFHAFVSSAPLRVPSSVTSLYDSLRLAASVYVIDDVRELARLARDAAAFGGRLSPEELYELLQARADFASIEKAVDKEMYGFKLAEDCVVC